MTKIFFSAQHRNPDGEPTVEAQIFDEDGRKLASHVMTIEGAVIRMHDMAAAIDEARTQRTADQSAQLARLDAEWHCAFDALRAAGLEADADHPIAAAYRAASDAVNHANRARDFKIATK